METSQSNDNIRKLIWKPALDLLGFHVDEEVEGDDSVLLTQRCADLLSVLQDDFWMTSREKHT